VIIAAAGAGERSFASPDTASRTAAAALSDPITIAP
jgi:hypothetical protein